MQRNFHHNKNFLYNNINVIITFDKMKYLAEKLAKGIPHLRVDFYEVNDKVYLGELTFTPGAGLFKFKDKETNLYWGEQIKL